MGVHPPMAVGDDEREAENPAQQIGAELIGDPGADGTGEGVVSQGRDQDAEDDRPRALVAGGEEERQELSLVADFGEGDDTGGDQEGFHGDIQGRSGQPMTTRPLRPGDGGVVKGLAGRAMLARCPRHAGRQVC